VPICGRGAGDYAGTQWYLRRDHKRHDMVLGLEVSGKKERRIFDISAELQKRVVSVIIKAILFHLVYFGVILYEKLTGLPVHSAIRCY